MEVLDRMYPFDIGSRGIISLLYCYYIATYAVSCTTFNMFS